MHPSTSALSLNLPHDLKEEILNISHATGISLTAMVETALRAVATTYKKDGYLVTPLQVVVLNEKNRA